MTDNVISDRVWLRLSDRISAGQPGGQLEVCRRAAEAQIWYPAAFTVHGSFGGYLNTFPDAICPQHLLTLTAPSCQAKRI